MSQKRLTRLLLTSALGWLFVASQQAFAVSADDLRKLSGGVRDYITGAMEEFGEMQKKASDAEKIVIMNKQVDLQSILKGMKIDNDNNGFANWIARIGRQSEEINNADIAAKEQPAYDACANLTVSENLKDAQVTASAANTAIAGAADRASYARGPSGVPLPREVPLEQMDSIKRIVTKAASAQPNDSARSELLPGMDMAFLFSSAPEYKTISGDRLANARDMISIVAPPSRVVITNDMTEMRKAELLGKKIRQNAGNKMLQGILAKRVAADDGPSILESRDFMAQMKWAGNPSDTSGFLQMVTTGGVLHPENINRSRAVMKAFQIYNQVEAFEVNLAKEAALATIIANNLN